MSNQLKGWKVFKYNKRTCLEEDKLSYCKTKIEKYSERIFLDESSSDIIIYTTPSKHLELNLVKRNLEVRMFEWNLKETIMIILEKYPLDSIDIILSGRVAYFIKRPHSNEERKNRFQLSKEKTELYERENNNFNKLKDENSIKKHAIKQILCGLFKRNEESTVDNKITDDLNLKENALFGITFYKMEDILEFRKEFVKSDTLDYWIKRKGILEEITNLNKITPKYSEKVCSFEGFISKIKQHSIFNKNKPN